MAYAAEAPIGGAGGQSADDKQRKVPMNARLTDVLCVNVGMSARVCVLIQDIGLSYYTTVTSRRCGGGHVEPFT